MNIQNFPKIGISSVMHSKKADVRTIDVIDDDIAVFDTANVISFFDGPSKLEVAGLGICLQGYSRINISLREYELLPGRLMVMLPGQIIEGREISEDFKGLFVAVSQQLLEILPKMSNTLSLFLSMKDVPCVDLNKYERDSFIEYHSLIWRKIRNKTNIYRKESVLGLLQALFYEVCNIFRELVPEAPVTGKSRKEYLFEHFFHLLSQYYQSERSVKFYAEQLCLTPKHLSAVVKAVSGKTVGEWIDEYVILEAKALLNSSDMNIQEISDRMNFANQSFFGKYFKHYTGMSPKEYRKNK